MPRLLPLALLLTGACAGTLYAVTKGTSTSDPDAAYTCAAKQLESLGYKRNHYDPTERWYVGQKTEAGARRADIRFRQRVSRLDVKVRPDASGNTALEVTARTFDQYDNQQGLSETELSASANARQDAATMIQACSGS